MSVSKKFCGAAHDEISSEITLVWKITNISYCAIPKGQKVASPMFRFGFHAGIYGRVHQWRLCFYPQGNNTTSVECAMTSLSSYYNGKLDCHLCVCNTKELLLYSKYTELKFSGQGYDESNNLASFGREMFEKLSDDAIVLHCHIGKLASDKREGIVNLFAETRLSVRRNIFYWKVENFRSLQLEEENRHDWLIYPALGAPDNYIMNMTSKLFLSGTDLKDATVQIWLTLDLKAETFCSCAVFLMDENEKIVTYIEKESWLGSMQNIMKFSFQRQEISGLLCSDSLILRAEVNTSGDNGSMDQVVYGMETIEAIAAAKGSGFPDLSTDSVPSLPASSENCPSALSTDMLSLFKGEGPHSDFELRVAGRSFPVHQTVLGARSPVFRAMFASDMLETSKRSLELTDVDFDTTERMLLYAYTDQEPSAELDWDSLSNLYSAADKYALLGLRKMCGDRLTKELDLDNAPRLLRMADGHEDPLLKGKVVEYLISQGPVAIEAENWKKLEQEAPKLAVVVMRQIMKEKWV